MQTFKIKVKTNPRLRSTDWKSPLAKAMFNSETSFSYSLQFDLSSLSGQKVVMNGTQDLRPNGAQVLIVQSP